MKPNTWSTLPSMEIYPKKTFFGLDKSTAHCFTLPKVVTEMMIDHFNLNSNHLQRSIVFVIDGRDYDAEIRLVIMDRSKPNKLEKEELPKRTVAQFQWKSYPETCKEIRLQLASSYNLIRKGEVNDSETIIFHHGRMNRFMIEFTRKDKLILNVEIGD